jgi:hypothetical protein
MRSESYSQRQRQNGARIGLTGSRVKGTIGGQHTSHTRTATAASWSCCAWFMRLLICCTPGGECDELEHMLILRRANSSNSLSRNILSNNGDSGLQTDLSLSLLLRLSVLEHLSRLQVQNARA